MRLQGLHFLLTYKCNAACAHCFLASGPDREGLLAFEEAKQFIDAAKDIPSIDYFFVEGGEPFLYPKIVEKIIAYATKKGYWIGILSNGFWARNTAKALEILRPLKTAGLQEIGISTDSFHQKDVPLESALNAVKAAQELDIGVSLMVTSNSKREIKEIKKKVAKAGIKVGVYGSGVRGRGRGLNICEGKPVPWQELTECLENHIDPGRVHVGPDGDIHLCQGLLLGDSTNNKELRSLFEEHLKKPNIIAEQLIKGGPAALAKFAQKYGFEPKEKYKQGCELCFETRTFLQDKFPSILAPKENYPHGKKGHS